MRHSFLCVMSAGLLISPNAIARTDVDNLHYTGEVFMMITDFCPRATYRTYGQAIQTSQFSNLAEVLAPPFNPGTKSVMNLPDMRGRRAVHTGQLNSGDDYRFGHEGGTFYRYLGNAMPPHSHETEPHTHSFDQHDHDATLATSADVPSVPNPAQNSFGAFPSGSQAYADGAPNTDYMNAGNIFVFLKANTSVTGASFTTRNYGSNAYVRIFPPFTALNYCITVNGKTPEEP